MELLDGRPATDFKVGVYTYEQLQDSHFMSLEDARAHEEIKSRGWQYAYTQGNAKISGMYVRVFKVWTSKEKLEN